MKKLTITFTLGLIFIAAGLTAQTLKERLAKAEKIYIAPVRPTFYFLMDNSAAPKPFRDIAEKGSGQTGLLPAWYKEYNSYWEANKSKYFYDGKKLFEVGDTICTSSTLMPDQLSKDWYTIVNMVSPEVIADINAKLIAQCEEMFGRKVEMWPDGKYFSEKAWEYYDENGVECNFYLLAEITGDQNVKQSLDVVHDADSNKDTFIIKNKVNSTSGMGQTNFIQFTLFEKTKAGKKGKKVASSYETIFEPIDEKEFPLSANYPKTPSDFDSENGKKFRGEAFAAGKTYSDEVIKTLEVNFPKAMEGFFKKLEKSLNK